jgi:hypothetical protein
VSNRQPSISEDEIISAPFSHYPLHVQKSMTACNLKNIQTALNYLNKMEALDSQNEFRKDRSLPDKREYNQGPRSRQTTGEIDGRRRADFRYVRQVILVEASLTETDVFKIATCL